MSETERFMYRAVNSFFQAREAERYMQMKWKFQQIEPAVARGTFREEYMDSPEWDAEIKYDGDRRIAQIMDGRVRFTGRKKSKKDDLYVEKTDNVPHLAEPVLIRAEGLVLHPPMHSRLQALEGTVLDGEIVTPDSFLCDSGGRSKHVTSIMGSHPAEALRKQRERGFLEYVVFDCLYHEGVDVRGLARDARRTLASKVVARWGNPGVRMAERLPEQVTAQQWLDHLWDHGEEGIILKRRAAPYGDRQAWVKRKTVINADAFIVGYEQAKAQSKKADGTTSATRYAEQGWIGALRVAQYRDGELWECASVSGMDDELRAAISENPKKYLKLVVELKANAREPSGRFRHPQFVRFRDDKAPADCVYSQDET